MSNNDIKNIRLDHSVILEWIDEGSSVLEMGCGGGDLLHLLSQQKKANVSGLEIDERQYSPAYRVV